MHCFCFKKCSYKKNLEYSCATTIPTSKTKQLPSVAVTCIVVTLGGADSAHACKFWPSGVEYGLFVLLKLKFILFLDVSLPQEVFLSWF